jgi:hypothetical protein
MDQKKQNQGQPNPRQGKDLDSDRNLEEQRGGNVERDRSRADDRASGARPIDDQDQAIPELDEPDVEGVGNEGRTNTSDATMPPRRSNEPKRNTL